MSEKKRYNCPSCSENGDGVFFSKAIRVRCPHCHTDRVKTMALEDAPLPATSSDALQKFTKTELTAELDRREAELARRSAL